MSLVLNGKTITTAKKLNNEIVSILKTEMMPWWFKLQFYNAKYPYRLVCLFVLHEK